MSPSTVHPITCWLIDTRVLWPGERIAKAAPEALRLLSADEQEVVLRKLHIQDAKMSLASALLKRLYIAKTQGVPWKDIKFGRKGDPVHGKPCYIPSNGSESPVDFNVSHQAGLVALVGCPVSDAEIGVDIVCVNERNDYRTIDQIGLDGFVDIYEEIFSAEELWDMKYNIDTFQLLDGTEVTQEELGRHDRCCRRDQELTATLQNGDRRFSSDLLVDAKLRRFYTFWCYKEAYIKLTGEAMLADWLQKLEFKNVRSPKAGTVARCSTHGVWGEKVHGVEIWLRGQKIQDVQMDIQAFEEQYMISTARRAKTEASNGPMPGFHTLHLVSDIYSVAAP